MKRLMMALCLALAGWSGTGLAVQRALAASLCVGSGSGCYPTIQAALDAAHNGDVIRLGPGTFAGGITIDKSVQIVGAGAGATIIQGGGPVVTVLPSAGTSQSTVIIRGVTMTGGSNTSTPASFAPQAGGLAVVSPAAGGRGATVTIINSLITGNSVAPTATGDCGSGCTFAVSLAGGIFNAGTLTLSNTTVSNNDASTVNAGAASTATTAVSIGGGILNEGALTLHASTVSGNVARVAADGPCVFGSGGGIVSDGPVTMDGGAISGNSLTLSSTSTDQSCEVQGIGGGLRLTASATATVRGSVITANSVTTTGNGGFVNSAAGAIDDDGTLVLQDNTVSNNRVTSTAPSTQPTGGVLSDAGAIEIDGAATIKNTAFTGNSASATSPAGAVTNSPNAVGGALVVTTDQQVTVTDSVISGNSVSASSAAGTAFALGGGIFNCSATLTVRDTSVSNNRGTATGQPGGAAQGGGIWNSECGPGSPPILTLIDSAVTHNTLTASSGIAVQGGGVFNTGTVTLRDSVIAGNSPDQCFGC